MTSYDAPRPAGRRRTLGRGPGTAPPEPAPPVAPPEHLAPAPPDPAPEPEPAAPTAEPMPEPDAAPLRDPGAAGAPTSAPESAASRPAAGSAGPPGPETGDRSEPETAAEPVLEAGVTSAPEAGDVPRADAGERPDPDAPAVDAPGAARPSPSSSGQGSDGAARSVPAPEAVTRRVAGPGSGAGPADGGSAPPGDAEAGEGGFKVRLANFEGPFDLLLQLIAKHKLDVTEVALSRVTDEFMAYIRALGPDWDLDETTEFLVVAATLLDLKAARLLPAAEVEDEADLALLEARDLLFARLLQYRAYKQIAEIFSRRLDAEARRYPRTVGLEPHHAELLPEVVISIGSEGFARLAVKAMQPRPEPQVYVEHIHAPLVSVQEQAAVVVARLKELGEAPFRDLVADTDDTLTVVARFLALLELYREKAVALEQEAALGELLVRWTGGEGDAAPMVTDEFDRPPEAPKEEENKP
ncbi:segregation and condensation protein A [Streptomyces poriticola]|uniref:segregation and condensation protein A n=1 Tax=Streptomyces poriticola TaxID=3120506 RepID=UPI002FCDEF4B